MPRFSFLVFLALLSSTTSCQRWTEQAITSASEAHFPAAIQDLRDFVAIPNDGHYPEQILANVNWAGPRLGSLDFNTQVLTVNEVPFVLATKEYHPDRPWVLFYLQIDGQPVDASQWDQPSPFEVALKRMDAHGQWQTIPWPAGDKVPEPDDRFFGRSTSDSKGPALSLINALEILRDRGEKPAFNVKLILDFQEEMSSPQLPELVRQYRQEMAADRLVVMDGTRHVSNLPTLTFGARGIATTTLRVFGPRQPMHSGQYGNFVPNPVFRLSKLLAGMKDDDGRVLIPGWYDGIELSEEEKKRMNAVPENADSIAARIGIARPERVGETYQEALAYPTLNVRGLKAAYVGGAVRTIIPEEAIAMIDIRLVPESDGQRLLDALREYVEAQGYHLVREEPTEAERRTHDKIAALYGKVSYAAYRTPLDAPIGDWLGRALTRAFGTPPVKMRTTGGSQPISPFIQALGLPAVSVRIPNPDNNIHAANENLRVGNYLEGIRTCLGVLTESL
ncbi:M20/M25/M40 family metallo-hydrolase [Neolewinella agarilytica]|uniref:M20/M25/M40 family metallo-hydrolase n=1 Tax=Neolewinella agarilytica TaxID=478744 RepID=UPI0023551515|nr:M20/M25/M40 family metallo-hydrolase [Neolewinella agarilytica]